MKIIVTGGAGFIGSHICKRLLDAGNEVFCLDSFITGNPRNLDQLKDNSNFHLFEQDINVPLKPEVMAAIGKVDQIYNLACPASPADYREIPLQTLWVNAAGVKNMLEIAAKQDSAILHASTSEVYGDPLQHPQKETYFGNVNPIGERSCYNEGKRFAESMAMVYYKDFKFPLKIARIFNTYGANMRKMDGRVIPEFINKALHGEPLRIYGDGKQTRSFCYIDDMVDGLIALMQTPRDFTGPVNIGNADEISIQELAQKIITLTASTSLISYAPRPEDDPVQRQPDLTLASKTFGFKPKIAIAEGLKTTVEYFKRFQ